MDFIMEYYLTKKLDKQVIKIKADRFKITIKPIHSTTCNLCGQYIYCCVCKYPTL